MQDFLRWQKASTNINAAQQGGLFIYWQRKYFQWNQFQIDQQNRYSGESIFCLTQCTFLLQPNLCKSAGAEQACFLSTWQLSGPIPSERRRSAFKLVMSKLYKSWYRPPSPQEMSSHIHMDSTYGVLDGHQNMSHKTLIVSYVKSQY